MKKFTNTEKIIILISFICLTVIDFFRRFFVHNEMFAIYSILMSFLQGVFTVVLEYTILKKWIKNKKLLMAFIVILAVFYFIIYVVAIKNTGDGTVC